ncbi:MAG: restriction endonuclease subunit S [Patescibacteria group bacterium]
MVTSIIQKSQLEGAQRVDSEYYQPEYLEAEQKIKSLKNKSLGEVLEILTDYHANGSYSILKNYGKIQLELDYALMVRAVDLQNSNFEDDVRYVSESSYGFLKKTKIFGNELIIDKIGNAGSVYFMPKLNRPVTLGMNLFMLRLKKGFDSRFVYIFLNSKYGKLLIYRRVTGTNPSSIDKNSVRSIQIPIFSIEDQSKIGQLVDLSFEEKENSKRIYQQAEDLLLEDLGLKNVVFEDELSSVVNYFDVISNNRIDPEYFQPKYQKLIERIKNQNAKTLGELVSMRKGFEPGSEAYQEEGKLFIRVSSVSKLGIEKKDQKYLIEELYQKLKKDYEPKLGDILLTKDATPGIAYVVKESVEGIISGGILDLKVKENIESEYLALCISSIVGQWQAQRDAGGSIIAHWKPEQIRNLLIPVLPMEKQKEIAELVKKSHEARKKSKELLEEAKRRVEEMIEKGGEK